MNLLSEVRAALSFDLAAAADVPVFGHVPEGLTPPVIVLEPADPYVQPGDTYLSTQVNLKIWLVVAGGRNTKTVADLDALIMAAVGVVRDDWVFSVGPPGPTTFNADSVYPACQISVSRNFDSTQESEAA